MELESYNGIMELESYNGIIELESYNGIMELESYNRPRDGRRCCTLKSLLKLELHQTYQAY